MKRIRSNAWSVHTAGLELGTSVVYFSQDLGEPEASISILTLVRARVSDPDENPKILPLHFTGEQEPDTGTGTQPVSLLVSFLYDLSHQTKRLFFDFFFTNDSIWTRGTCASSSPFAPD